MHWNESQEIQVPYLSKEQIRRQATMLLSEYGSKFEPVVVPPVPVEDILEVHLPLSFEFVDMKALFGFGDVLGAIWFGRKLVQVEKGLDPVLFPKSKGRYHFTLAHEVGHWRLHRRYYSPDNSPWYADSAPSVPDHLSRSSEFKKPVEWQADYFAAHLLMPTPLLRSSWEQWHGSLNPLSFAEVSPGDPADAGSNKVLERYLRPFADLFEVSAESMRIRMQEIGLAPKQQLAAGFDRGV